MRETAGTALRPTVRSRSIEMFDAAEHRKLVLDRTGQPNTVQGLRDYPNVTFVREAHQGRNGVSDFLFRLDRAPSR